MTIMPISPLPEVPIGPKVRRRLTLGVGSGAMPDPDNPGSFIFVMANDHRRIKAIDEETKRAAILIAMKAKKAVEKVGYMICRGRSIIINT